MRALDQVKSLRYAANKQKSISTSKLLEPLAEIEEELTNVTKNYEKWNRRAQKAETQVQKLKEKLREEREKREDITL